MSSLKIHKKISYTFVIIVLILGLSNSGLHPVTGNGGYTGAPGDSACNQCHSGGGSLDGDISISGLPSVIEAGQTYTIEVTVSNPNGNAARSGFQLVALNGTNGHAGSMSNNSTNTQLRTSGGKTYFGHSPAQNFPAGNTLSFSVDWTAPSVTGSVPEIKFYASSVIANGNGSTSGDLVVLTSEIIPIAASSDPLSISIISSEDPLCFGDNSGTVTSEAAGGSGNYSFMWNNGSSESTITNVFSGVYSVTVTDSDGNIASASAELVDPDLLSATAVAPNIPCTENLGSITILAQGGVGSYTYDIGGSTQSSGTFDNLSPGTYIFTVTDDNGCIYSDEIVLTADIPPVAVAQVTDTLTCLTTQVMLSGLGSSSGNAIMYQWSTQDGNIVSGINDINAVSDEPGTYTLDVTNTDNGCSTQASVTVVSDTLPPSLSTTGGELDCNNSQIHICALIQEGVTVSWNIDGQTVTDSCTVVTEGGNYVATATGSNGCQAISTAIVTVSDDLPVISIDTPDTIDCITSEIILQGSVAVNGNITYLWTTSDGQILSGDSTFNPVVAQGGLYTLQVVNQDNGCSSSESVTVLENTALPVVTFENGVLVCRDSSIVIEVDVEGNGPFDYQWTTNNGSIVSGADSSAVTVNASGIYFIEVTHPSSNCISVDTLAITEDFNDPTAEFSFNLLNNIFEGIPVTADTTSTFLWAFGNGITSEEARPVLELSPGDYNICLTVSNACGADTTCQELTIMSSSSADADFVSSVSVYPNPASDRIFLDVNFSMTDQIELTLFSIAGSPVVSKRYIGNIKDTWDISDLPSGIYTLRVNGKEFMFSKIITVLD